MIEGPIRVVILVVLPHSGNVDLVSGSVLGVEEDSGMRQVM